MSPTSSSTPVLQLHHDSHFYKKEAPVLVDASFAVPMVVLLCIALLGQAASGGSVIITFALLIGVGASQVRMRTKWLAALPLSHRTRLLALVTPVVFLIALVPVLASFRLLEWLFSQSPPGAPLRESSA